MTDIAHTVEYRCEFQAEDGVRCTYEAGHDRHRVADQFGGRIAMVVPEWASWPPYRAITDAMVERAARALHAEECDCDVTADIAKGVYGKRARAALTAALGEETVDP